MVSHWKGVTFQTDDQVPRCSLFKQNRVSLPMTKALETNKDISISSKKKIKCPQSKFLKHQKQNSQILKQKQLSPIPSSNILLPKYPITFNRTPIKSNKFQIHHYPPLYKAETKPHNRTINLIVHSPRQIKQMIKIQNRSPIQIKPRKYYIQQQSENLNNLNVCRLKTLQQFDPKMTQSLVDSTHYQDYRLQESQIMIDFFNDQVQNNLTNTNKNSAIKIEWYQNQE